MLKFHGLLFVYFHYYYNFIGTLLFMESNSSALAKSVYYKNGNLRTRNYT